MGNAFTDYIVMSAPAFERVETAGGCALGKHARDAIDAHCVVFVEQWRDMTLGNSLPKVSQQQHRAAIGEVADTAKRLGKSLAPFAASERSARRLLKFKNLKDEGISQIPRSPDGFPIVLAQDQVNFILQLLESLSTRAKAAERGFTIGAGIAPTAFQALPLYGLAGGVISATAGILIPSTSPNSRFCKFLNALQAELPADVTQDSQKALSKTALQV